MEPKILLIDDSAILRRIAVNVLSARAICGEVITATRATEGFARACASGVGLVLVDYQIAGTPNVDLCRRLLEEPRTARVPVILLLGPGMSPPAKNSLPANIVDFLVKPFTPEQLVSMVKAVLGMTAEVVPVGRLREAPAVPAAHRPETMSDQQQVAAAVNATALVRRETNRLLHARSASRQAVAAAPAVRETPANRTVTGVTRLRTALIQAAHGRETGALRVRAGTAPATEVYFENGHIVVVATQDSERYSEDADGVVPPKVSPATLDEVLSEQSQTGVPFFLALGARGLLSKTTAIGLMHRFGERQFARFWAAPLESLKFDFVSMDALPGFALRLEPRRESVDEWLLGASRHLRPTDIAAGLRREGFAGPPSFTDGGAAMVSTLRVDDQEREFCRRIGARRDLAAVAKDLGITAEHAYLLLFRFRCLGSMEYRPTSSAFVVTPRTNVRRVLPLQR